MATLAQRTQAVEEKVDSLESILTRFMARTDESMARTDKAIVRLELEGIVEHFVQEGARAREEAARERREMNQRWGELANKMGTVVEDIVAPSVRRLAREVFDCGDLVYFVTRQTARQTQPAERGTDRNIRRRPNYRSGSGLRRKWRVIVVRGEPFFSKTVSSPRVTFSGAMNSVLTDPRWWMS